MAARWRWYLTIAAVRQYMEIAGLTGDLEDDNPDFVRAQNDLGEISLTATPADTPPTDSGGIIYRPHVMIAGRKTRLELTVTPAGRAEGDLPQLVRVRLKGGRR